MMTSQVLFDTLGHLGKDEFHNFKWHLQQGDGYSYSAIPKGKLEDAERRDTVDLMMQTYTPRKAMVVTRRILEKINRNDLVERLSGTRSGSEGQSHEEKVSYCVMTKRHNRCSEENPHFFWCRLVRKFSALLKDTPIQFTIWRALHPITGHLGPYLSSFKPCVLRAI